MENYLKSANSLPLYLIVGGVLLFVASGCLVFIIRSYKAGLKMGMDKKVLKKTLFSSFTFSLLPSLSILLGVIALSGNLGIPSSWLRLSVVGNLSYEAIASESAAQAIGTKLDSSILTTSNLVTILLVMTIGICWGILCTIFILKPYSKKCNKLLNKNKKSGEKTFADWAMVALFIGFCGTFTGSYVAEAIRGITFVPLLTCLVSLTVMKALQVVGRRFSLSWLDNFSLAFSMLCGMASSVLFNIWGIR